MSRSFQHGIALVAAFGLATGPGCASMATTAGVSTTRLDGSVGQLGTRTRFELEPSDARAPAAAPRDDADKRAPTARLFLAGLIVGGVATAIGLGTGVGALVTERQIQRGYDDGMTRSELDDLETRGDVLGALSVTGFSLGAAGFLTSIITYGIDYTRCGPAARKRRDCRDRD